MLTTKKTFMFIYNLCAFFCISPKWNFRLNCPEKPNTFHLFIMYSLSLKTVIIVFYTFFYNYVYRTDHYIAFYLFDTVYFAIILTALIISRNKWKTTWLVLMEMIMKDSKNRYWQQHSEIKHNHILVQFICTSCLYILKVIHLILHFIPRIFDDYIILLGDMACSYLEYFIFLNTILLVCILWAINNNFNSIINSLRITSSVDVLKHLQMKFGNTIKMINLFNQLFGLTIFFIVVVNGLAILASLSLAQLFIIEDDFSTIFLIFCIVDVLWKLVI